MTIAELYRWSVENFCTDAQIVVDITKVPKHNWDYKPELDKVELARADKEDLVWL